MRCTALAAIAALAVVAVCAAASGAKAARAESDFLGGSVWKDRYWAGVKDANKDNKHFKVQEDPYGGRTASQVKQDKEWEQKWWGTTVASVSLVGCSALKRANGDLITRPTFRCARTGVLVADQSSPFGHDGVVQGGHRQPLRSAKYSGLFEHLFHSKKWVETATATKDGEEELSAEAHDHAVLKAVGGGSDLRGVILGQPDPTALGGKGFVTCSLRQAKKYGFGSNDVIGQVSLDVMGELKAHAKFGDAALAARADSFGLVKHDTRTNRDLVYFNHLVVPVTSGPNAVGRCMFELEAYAPSRTQH